MIENLCRYSTQRKELSEVGYRLIKANWQTIIKNSSGLSVEEHRIAYNYLIKEHQRITTTKPTILKREEQPKRKTLLSRLKSWVGF